MSEKKAVPQHSKFRCGTTHNKTSLKKICTTFNLQEEILKKEMDHDELFEDTGKNQSDERLGYVKNDSLCTDFAYARYSRGMEELTGFSRKNNLTLPLLAWKFLNSWRDESDELIYTYGDKFLKLFVRQISNGAGCTAFVQYHISKRAEIIFETKSDELVVKGNIREIIERFVEKMSKILTKKTIVKVYDSNFDDNRKKNVKRKNEWRKKLV